MGFQLAKPLTDGSAQRPKMQKLRQAVPRSGRWGQSRCGTPRARRQVSVRPSPATCFSPGARTDDTDGRRRCGAFLACRARRGSRCQSAPGTTDDRDEGMICSPLASTRCRWASSRASRSSWSSGEPSGSARCLYGSGSVVIGRRYPPATDLGAGTPLAGGACVRAQMTQMLCSPPGRRWVPPGPSAGRHP